jgi:hypothetical protein
LARPLFQPDTFYPDSSSQTSRKKWNPTGAFRPRPKIAVENEQTFSYINGGYADFDEFVID